MERIVLAQPTPATRNSDSPESKFTQAMNASELAYLPEVATPTVIILLRVTPYPLANALAGKDDEEVMVMPE